MATGGYTHGTPLSTTQHSVAQEKTSLSHRVETAGRELARYGLVAVVGWIVSGHP